MLQNICTGDVKTIMIILNVKYYCYFIRDGFLILKVWNIRNVWICSIELFVFANMENKDYWNKIYVMLFSSYLTIKIKNLLKMW